VLPLKHHSYDPACHQIPLVSPKCSDDGEESGALTSPKHLSPEPHDETSDTSAEMMDMAVDSKLTIFSPTKKTLQASRHPGTNPRHDLESVCTEPTVDTNDSLDCTNEDEVILFLFPEIFAFVSDLESELDARMEEVFRLWIAPPFGTTLPIGMPYDFV
jgi:hypothetical protein